MRSIRRRLIVTVAVSLAIGFAVTAVLVWRIVAASATREFDARLSTALSELASAADIGPDGILSLARSPGLPAFGDPHSGWYWSVARDGTVLARSRSLLLSSLPLASDKPVDDVSVEAVGGPDGQMLRIRYRLIAVQGGAQTLVLSAAGPANAIGRDIRFSMQPLLAALAIVGAISVVLVILEIRHGLRPLQSLVADVERAARGEIGRLPDSGYVELAPLTAGINSLIGQVESTIARARTQAANLAHAIKTPLSLISARNERGDRLPAADVALSVETIRRQIDHHLKRARIAGRLGLASEAVPVRPVIDDIVVVMRGSFRDRRLAIAADIDPGLVLSGEREDFEEMFGNLVENACKWAKQTVNIVGAREDESIILFVDDDGPGVPESHREQALRRGERLDESMPGSGLGLSIADEIARLYGGTLRLAEAPCGGLRAELRFAVPKKPG